MFARHKDVLLVHHCGMGFQSHSEAEKEESPESRNRVELTTVVGVGRQNKIQNVNRLIRSGCRAAELSSISENLPNLPMDLTIDAGIVLGLGKAMRKLQTLHPKVGGTHSAALFKTSGEAVTQAVESIFRIIFLFFY